VLVVHIRHPARRWFRFQNMGPSPRLCHTMASEGTRVFVIGGNSSAGARGDESTLIHVLETSTFFLFVMSFVQPPSLKTQSTSNTRIPTPTLLILMRAPSNSPRGRPRVPRPRGNHNTRHPLHRIILGNSLCLLLKKILPTNWVPPPPRRLLARETPV
jgi:hypothetical protein